MDIHESTKKLYGIPLNQNKLANLKNIKKSLTLVPPILNFDQIDSKRSDDENMSKYATL
jgi:hypothetical protein